MKNTRTNKIPTSYIGSIMNLTKQIIAIPPAYGSVETISSRYL